VSAVVYLAGFQKDGRLSEERIAQTVHIPPTTVHYAMSRIRERNFFRIKAVPCLERFPDIPKAIIGFTHIHPVRIHGLRERCGHMPSVVQFFHSEKDALLLVIDASMDALTKKLYDIMRYVNEKPCVYILSPKVAKCDYTIPDQVLEAVFYDLPDWRTQAPSSGGSG
jgi:DNA-binding Lrp family transcriptional regulator